MFRLDILLLGLCVLVVPSFADDATVFTSLGRIKGVQTVDKETGKKVYEFRGIRYAKPPTGERRFRKPDPVEPWEGEYDATNFGYACPQSVNELFDDKSKNQSEDCLFLNIYVPRSISSEEKLSVMVWIHGGGFIIGNGHFYDGTRLAVDGNVVVVTINYRLGILGFLALYHPASRGNYGLWDQKLALHWISDYIEAFRGNPASITIFGESAGGMSVSAQSLIPSNKDLFQRVIAQSGVISRTLLVRKKVARKALERLPAKTKCKPDDLFQFVDCLRQVDVEILLEASSFWNYLPEDSVTLETVYGVVVDGEIFPEHPVKLLQDPSSHHAVMLRSLDFMTGTTSQEGSLIYMSVPPNVQERYNFNISENIPSDFICEGILRPFIRLNYKGNDAIYKKGCKFFTSVGSKEELRNRAADLFADMMFTSATREMLNFHTKQKRGKTYQYQFSKISPKPFAIPPPKWFKGSGHGDELLYLFRSEKENRPGMIDITLTGHDRRVSDDMISLWTSFAKTGTPSTGKGSIPWIEYDPHSRVYMDIECTNVIKTKLK
ncbi:hypothetical protein FSP39_002059 [Pinctada imbricata]|uniref:Carboxylic ester hydrolase n=1 Tax=Pinctada imbricata TaxID=66713 RepID=A0AA89CCF9_PINIB|nr:hypothetical protein FSP39_002059 [Pinctada imbricata]